MNDPRPDPTPADLSGLEVRGSDDDLVGRVRDIFTADRTRELCAVTVEYGVLASRKVLIPVEVMRENPLDPEAGGVGGPIRLALTTAQARSGLAPPETGHLEADDLAAARAALAGAAPDATEPSTR